MKYFRTIFILFGLFELFAAYTTYGASAASVNADWGGQFMTPESMTFAKGFANAITAIGLMSIVGFWVKDRMGLIALCVGFIYYNVAAAYGCSISIDLSERYVVGMYAHIIFSILFIVMLVLTLRKASS